MWEISSGSGET